MASKQPENKNEMESSGSSSQLVNMEVTEDNPINTARHLIPANEHVMQDTDASEMTMQQIQDTVASALISSSASGNLATGSSMARYKGETPTQVAVMGGEFIGANIGPQNISAIKKVGINDGNFQGAHFGPKTVNVIHQHIHPDSKQGASNESTEQPRTSPAHPVEKEETVEQNDGRVHLTGEFWIFSNRKLAKNGLVFAGEQTTQTMNRKIAIKLIKHKENNLREVKNLLTLIPHSNVASIIHSDICQHGHVRYMYIAMDLCATQTLQDYIKDRNSKGIPFNLSLAFKHTHQLLAAMKHIHRKKIIHRDLTPDNILFSLCGEDIKIVDFGVSKQLQNGRSVTGLSILRPGTDGYRAPETYNENQISLQSDIFSLGLVVHYLWSHGVHPFGNDLDKWNYNIKNNLGLDLSHLLVPDIPAATDLLNEMLQFLPSQRPTIVEILDDQYIKKDILQDLINSLRQIWNGEVIWTQCQDTTSSLPCQIYETPQEQGNQINTLGWSQKLSMRSNDFFEIKLQENWNKTKPAGYIVMPLKQAKDIIQDLCKNQQMGWIEIEGDQAMLLLSSPDYPELYGFFIPNQTVFLSHILGIVSQQSTESSEASGDNLLDILSGNHILEPQQEEVAGTSEASSHTVQSADKTANYGKDLTSDDLQMERIEEEEEEISQARTSRNKYKHTASDIIPWWIIPDILP